MVTELSLEYSMMGMTLPGGTGYVLWPGSLMGHDSNGDDDDNDDDGDDDDDDGDDDDDLYLNLVK